MVVSLSPRSVVIRRPSAVGFYLRKPRRRVACVSRFPTAAGAAVAPRSAIGRERRRRWRRRVRLGRLLACLGLGSWDCGATGRPAPGALCFSAFCELPWSSGPWCFARCASTGPWARGRVLTAMYMAPAVGWALPWHLSCLCAGSATAEPPPLPLPSAKAGGPSILHHLLEWASTIEQRSNIKTWFRAS